MDLTALTLGSRQLFILRCVLGLYLDMHFDNDNLRLDEEVDAHALLELQVLVDVCDKVDVEVPREVRSFLADRR